MFVGNSFYAFMQWAQLSVIVKFTTSLTLGYYTLALASTAPVFMLSGLHLRALIVTDAKKEWNFSSYFFMRSITMGIALLFVGIYAWVGNCEFRILFLVAILKSIEGLAEIFNAQQQLHEKMHYVALSFILKGASATVAIFTGVYFWNSLITGLILAIGLNTLVLFYNDYFNCRKLLKNEMTLCLKNLRLKSLFLKALPLGIVLCIISLNTNVSKYITEYFLGTETQGVYSTLAYCLVVGSFVNNAVGQSFTPRLSRYYAEKNLVAFKKLYQKYVTLNVGIGFLLFIASLLGGYYFLRIAFSESIANYSNLFSLLMLSGIPLYVASSLGYTLTSMRVFKVQPFINGTVIVINIIGCYCLIKQFGLYGVVYASILAFTVQSLLTFYFIRRNL
jgi:O-antigen/teichoic acid export membrane protein